MAILINFLTAIPYVRFFLCFRFFDFWHELLRQAFYYYTMFAPVSSLSPFLARNTLTGWLATSATVSPESVFCAARVPLLYSRAVTFTCQATHTILPFFSHPGTLPCRPVFNSHTNSNVFFFYFYFYSGGHLLDTTAATTKTTAFRPMGHLKGQ